MKEDVKVISFFVELKLNPTKNEENRFDFSESSAQVVKPAQLVR
ncbi:hypothetical protein B1R32_1369 [Abditibacterium utsteinense]|uniref:Uncharacterized protein n=1 Tax=Abditibacterium utsteinense TaxID=1960156 RepID=A0A2S8SNR1_9BACT|nr:hypothetical protein B1R32_1369 [Abditibacterium utsteinense]